MTRPLPPIHITCVAVMPAPKVNNEIKERQLLLSVFVSNECMSYSLDFYSQYHFVTGLNGVF